MHSEASAINTEGNAWGEYFLKIKINTGKRWLSITGQANIQKKYFKGDQMRYMIFVSNMLMISPHIAFNIPFDLMYDICYPLHAILCFCSGCC